VSRSNSLVRFASVKVVLSLLRSQLLATTRAVVRTAAFLVRRQVAREHPFPAQGNAIFEVMNRAVRQEVGLDHGQALGG